MKYAWSQSLDSFLLLTSRDSCKGEPSRSQVKSVQTASHLIGVGLSQQNEYLMAYFRRSSSFMAGPVCSVLMGVSVSLVIDGFQGLLCCKSYRLGYIKAYSLCSGMRKPHSGVLGYITRHD